jgi:hypothetical protein
MANDLIVHIGLEKTGTTSFQQFCTDQTRITDYLGLYYPKQSHVFLDNSHSPMVAAYLPQSARSFVSPRWVASREAVASWLANELASGKYHQTLISSELFSSRFSAVEVDQLAADFSRFSPKIIVLVRDHFALIRSAYATTLLAGARFTFDEFIGALWAPDALRPPRPTFEPVYYRYCRYREMIAPWERSFGESNVRVLKYDRGGAIDIILSEIVGQPIALPGAFHESYKLNEATPPYLLEYIRVFNRVAPDWDDVFLAGRSALWPLVCETRRRFIDLIGALVPPADSAPPLAVSGESLARVTALAAADRDWLARRGIVFDPEPPSRAGDCGGMPALRPDIRALLEDAVREPSVAVERRVECAQEIVGSLERLKAEYYRTSASLPPAPPP